MGLKCAEALLQSRGSSIYLRSMPLPQGSMNKSKDNSLSRLKMKSSAKPENLRATYSTNMSVGPRKPNSSSSGGLQSLGKVSSVSRRCVPVNVLPPVCIVNQSSTEEESTSPTSVSETPQETHKEGQMASDIWMSIQDQLFADEKSISQKSMMEMTALHSVLDTMDQRKLNEWFAKNTNKGNMYQYMVLMQQMMNNMPSAASPGPQFEESQKPLSSAHSYDTSQKSMNSSSSDKTIPPDQVVKIMKKPVTATTTSSSHSDKIETKPSSSNSESTKAFNKEFNPKKNLQTIVISPKSIGSAESKPKTNKKLQVLQYDKYISNGSKSSTTQDSSSSDANKVAIPLNALPDRSFYRAKHEKSVSFPLTKNPDGSHEEVTNIKSIKKDVAHRSTQSVTSKSNSKNNNDNIINSTDVSSDHKPSKNNSTGKHNNNNNNNNIEVVCTPTQRSKPQDVVDHDVIPQSRCKPKLQQDSTVNVVVTQSSSLQSRIKPQHQICDIQNIREKIKSNNPQKARSNQQITEKLPRMGNHLISVTPAPKNIEVTITKRNSSSQASKNSKEEETTTTDVSPSNCNVEVVNLISRTSHG